MLRFYLGRAVRHQTMRGDAADEAELAARQSGRRSIPAPVHQDRSDIRPVGHGAELVRGRRDRVPPDRARPHRGTAGAMPTDPLLAAEDAARSRELAGCLAAKARGRRLPRARAESRDSGGADDLTPDDPSLDDLVRTSPGLPERAGRGRRNRGRAEPGPAAGTPEGEPVRNVLRSRLSVEPASEHRSGSLASRTAAEVRPPAMSSSGPRSRHRSTASSARTRIGRTVALDLNETHTISLFGVQGGGKSYTLGSIIEAATLPAPPVNELPSPLATIVFHYSPTLDYEPEFTSMVAPNSGPVAGQRPGSPVRWHASGAGRCRDPGARRPTGAAAP